MVYMELVELGLNTPRGEPSGAMPIPIPIPIPPWPLLHDNDGGFWELDMRVSESPTITVTQTLRGTGLRVNVVASFVAQ